MHSVWCKANRSIGFYSSFSDGNGKYISTKMILNIDVWYHIVTIFDNKKAKPYLNGELENEDVTNKNIVQTKINEANFYIGGSGSNDTWASYQFFFFF